MESPSSKENGALQAAIRDFYTQLESNHSKSQIRIKPKVTPNPLTSGAECSFKLEDEFKYSLIYLPGAIDYLSRHTSDNALWSDDCEPAGRGICAFVNGWHLNLTQANLYHKTILAIEELLQQWNRNLVAEETATSWAHVTSLPLAAKFLDLALETSRPFTESPLFASLFEKWASYTTEITASASLLVLFLFVKRSSDDMLLFRHPLVLNAAFNRSLCRKHWEFAQDLLVTSCPAFYRADIQQYLL